ncbi:MAG: hypothetical protein IBJ15_02500 [Alphaproteobacteria bacterium]|nr:hypothetical protein [Alphaproteobacteria bacterium]
MNANRFDPLRFYKSLPNLGGTGRLIDDLPDALASPRDPLGADLSALAAVRDKLLDPARRWSSHFGWGEIADDFAAAYVKLFGAADRERRMLCAHIGYCARALADRDVPAIGVELPPIVGLCPWDWLPSHGTDFAIVSGDGDNFVWRGDMSGAARIGLPTQIDPIGEDTISVGSMYAPGAHVWTNGRIEAILDDVPVPLLFDWQGEFWRVRSDGRIGPAGRPDAIRLPATIHKARRIGDAIYAFDWSRAGVIYAVHLDTGAIATIEMPEIFQCNDLAYGGGAFFAVDKMQGAIFKYSDRFEYLGRRMGLGRGPGRSYDPITLRLASGNLIVLSWVTSSRIKLPEF